MSRFLLCFALVTAVVVPSASTFVNPETPYAGQTIHLKDGQTWLVLGRDRNALDLWQVTINGGWTASFDAEDLRAAESGDFPPRSIPPRRRLVEAAAEIERESP